jgi:hypothetical protein
VIARTSALSSTTRTLSSPERSSGGSCSSTDAVSSWLRGKYSLKVLPIAGSLSAQI